MSCNCRNEDGILSEKCFGTCKIGVIVEQEMQEQRDPLNGFAELILVQVDKRIDYALNRFHVTLEKEWSDECRNIFLEGFKEGFKFAKEMEDVY